MTVLDLLLGPLFASDEARGEQIGSLAGVPVFGLDAAGFRGIRSGGCVNAADSPQRGGNRLYHSDQPEHHCSSYDRIFLVSADDPFLVAKFVGGAWLTVLLIAGLLLIMDVVGRHYQRVFLETRSVPPLELTDLTPPLVIVPINHWSRIVKKALRFALKISPHVRAVHVDCGEGALIFCGEWCRFVDEPTREAGVATPQLVAAVARSIHLSPIVDCVLEVERTCPNQQVAVLIPELVQRRRHRHLLHNKRVAVLKGLLLLKGNQRIIVINRAMVSRVVMLPILSEGLTDNVRSRIQSSLQLVLFGTVRKRI